MVYYETSPEGGKDKTHVKLQTSAVWQPLYITLEAILIFSTVVVVRVSPPGVDQLLSRPSNERPVRDNLD